MSLHQRIWKENIGCCNFYLFIQQKCEFQVQVFKFINFSERDEKW